MWQFLHLTTCPSNLNITQIPHWVVTHWWPLNFINAVLKLDNVLHKEPSALTWFCTYLVNTGWSLNEGCSQIFCALKVYCMFPKSSLMFYKKRLLPKPQCAVKITNKKTQKKTWAPLKSFCSPQISSVFYIKRTLPKLHYWAPWKKTVPNHH